MEITIKPGRFLVVKKALSLILFCMLLPALSAASSLTPLQKKPHRLLLNSMALAQKAEPPIPQDLSRKVSREYRPLLKYRDMAQSSREKYIGRLKAKGLIKSNGGPYVKAIIKSSLKREELEKMGIRVFTKAKDVLTVEVPVEHFREIASHPGVIYIQAPRKLKLMNDVGSSSAIEVEGYFDGSPDVYTLRVESGTILSIRAFADPTSALDPSLSLKDGGGNLIAFDDNGGVPPDAEIDWSVGAAGTYRIEVSGLLSGSYKLVIVSFNKTLGISSLSGGDGGPVLYLGTNAGTNHLLGNTGKGVIVGIVDTGIDWCHPDFVDPSTGRSRILYLWDQTMSPIYGEHSPLGFYGVEYGNADINAALGMCNHSLVRSVDTDGHGTHVAGIAAGNGTASGGLYRGMAPEADIIVVKSDGSDPKLIDGVDYVFQKAAALGKPAVVNLSWGGHLDPHDGTSFLDTVLDYLSGSGRILVASAGNEGGDNIHAQLTGGAGDITLATNYADVPIDVWHDGRDGYQVKTDAPSEAGATIPAWHYLESGNDGFWGTAPDEVTGYPNGVNQSLISPSINLSGLAHPQLYFETHYELEKDYDYVQVEVSDDGGQTWQTVGFDGIAGDPCHFVPVLTGSTNSQWLYGLYDLSQFAGKTVRVRWLFFSDEAINDTGFFLDNVAIVDGDAVVYLWDFNVNDSGFTTTFNNSIAVKPGTANAEFVGKNSGENSDGAWVCLDYTNTHSLLNGDAEIYVYHSAYNQGYYQHWDMNFTRLSQGGSGVIDAWIADGEEAHFTGPSVPKDARGGNYGTVASPGTAHQIVTVGAIATKSAWTDVNGSPERWAGREFPDTGARLIYEDMGALAFFSSIGPTRDGRVKPDIVAPGSAIASVLSRDVDTTGEEWLVLYGGGYWMRGGTSMAAPMVTGAVALYLEGHPTATPDEVKGALYAAASRDASVGAVPNYEYGFGKLQVVPQGLLPPGSVKWTVSFNAPVWSSPAVANGSIYIGTLGGKIDAVDALGHVIWEVTTSDLVIPTPAIGPDGTVYVGSDDGNLYALDPADGHEKWRFTATGTDKSFESSPAIGTDGTIYVGNGNGEVYAINPTNGTKKWEFDTGAWIVSSPAVKGDMVYIASQNGKVYALQTSNGAKSWEYDTGDFLWSSPAVTNDGTIYIGGFSGKVYAINSNGTDKWTVSLASDYIIPSPAIGSDGTIYMGSDDGNLYALNADGTVKWAFSVPGPDHSIESSPAIGSDGRIYFGCGDGKVYAVNPDGSEAWEVATGSWIVSSPVIDASGALYIANEGGMLYAISTGAVGLNHNSPWPCFRGGEERRGGQE